jgi:nucleoside-diphosphate-sugar epimerase
MDPVFGALFEGEQLPKDGRIRLPDEPGFGLHVRKDRVPLHRPYSESWATKLRLQRHAVVTGGAQGIGRAVAERILASGGKVSIWARDRDLLDKTVAEIGIADRVQGLETDIADLA